jgi:hypothetical protein
MLEIADIRIRYGYWCIYTLLRREGWKDNHRRVYRVYCEEGLNLRSKRPRTGQPHIGWNGLCFLIYIKAGANAFRFVVD